MMGLEHNRRNMKTVFQQREYILNRSRNGEVVTLSDKHCISLQCLIPSASVRVVAGRAPEDDVRLASAQSRAGWAPSPAPHFGSFAAVVVVVFRGDREESRPFLSQ